MEVDKTEDQAERRRQCVPQVRPVGQLGAGFSWIQLISRSLSVLYELGTVAFIAWLYHYWRDEPSTRVDVLFPSFFPVIFGVMVDAYEVVSLLFFNRRRAVNPVAVGFDVALIGVGIFCFLLLGMVDRGSGELRGYWYSDMQNAMIFMIVFSVIHAGYIIMAALGIIHIYYSEKKIDGDPQLARSQAEIVQFSQRQALRASTGVNGPSVA
ncbi:hypothetical protein VTK26DRAFT_1181 [Humicola hyalothermophila]